MRSILDFPSMEGLGVAFRAAVLGFIADPLTIGEPSGDFVLSTVVLLAESAM
jgi:hypothetical protein